MDDQRFDNLARVLGRGTSRRTALKGIAGAAVGGALVMLGLARGVEGASAQSCGAEGVYCTAGGDCCSGVCSAYYCTAPAAPVASTCQNDGGPCAAGGDCCSGNCDGATGYCFTPAAADTTAAPAAAPAVTLPDTGAGPAAQAENSWVMPVAMVAAAAAVVGAARLHRSEETEG